MQITKRTRQLSHKLFASPLLPVLGWTKVVESIIATGPLVNWTIYATLVTLVWIYADSIKEAAEDAHEEYQND